MPLLKLYEDLKVLKKNQVNESLIVPISINDSLLNCQLIESTINQVNESLIVPFSTDDSLLNCAFIDSTINQDYQNVSTRRTCISDKKLPGTIQHSIIDKEEADLFDSLPSIIGKVGADLVGSLPPKFDVSYVKDGMLDSMNGGTYQFFQNRDIQTLHNITSHIEQTKATTMNTSATLQCNKQNIQSF